MTDHESIIRERLRELDEKLTGIRTNKIQLERAEYTVLGAMAELRQIVKRYESDGTD